MNQKFFSLLLLVSLVVSFACNDDEKPKSNFSIGDAKYTLTDGEYFTDPAGDYIEYHVSLNAKTSKQYRFVNFTVWAPNESGIPVGTFHIEDEEVYFNGIGVVDIANQDYIEYFHGFDSGEVVISKSGSTYTITFDIVIDGKHVTGTYKGKIELYNPK